MTRPITRSIGHGQLQAGLPNIPRARKQSLFKDVLRNTGRHLLKRKYEDSDHNQPRSHTEFRRETEALVPVSSKATTTDALSGWLARNKKRRLNMGTNSIAIHEDTSATSTAQDLQQPEYQIMNEANPNVQYSEDEDEESDNEIDETVAEDMCKLEENFKGISLKYRLINRIGEGMLVLLESIRSSCH